LADGRVLSRHIENAIGSTANPLSDKALETKFLDLADGILPRAQAERLMQRCWSIESLADAGVLGAEASA
jgi:hypothetical protein